MSPVLSRVATGQGFGSIVSYKRAYLASQGGGGYQISRSLRFNSADSVFLNRTPAVAGNRKTWTWAGWVKRAALGSTQMLFGTTGTTDATYSEIFFTSADKLEVALGYTTVVRIRTTQVFRDPSAWQHIVVAYDNTQATASNRLRLYVNGSEVTTFDSDSRSTFSNTDLGINSTQAHYIGTGPNSLSNYLNAYLADLHLIDGQQLDPSSFTTTDLTTGQLIPKAYTGSYGTNGFKLNFSDNSTTAALGTDSSGAGNTWTTNNFSVTAGVNNDSLTDTPTSYGTDTGVGGSVRGNYATLNPLFQPGTYSNGNLDLTTTAGNKHYRCTIGVSSGKWYWEFSPVSGSTPGIVALVNDSAPPTQNANQTGGYAYYSATGNKQTSGVDASYGATYTYGDVIGVAFDADNGTLVFYKNGVSQGTAFTGLTSGPYYPACSAGSGTSTTNFVFNAGQRAFAYQTPGTNRPAATFLALCDTNLPTPVVAKGSSAMDVKLYSGNSSTQNITGLNFSPDLVWLKCRSDSYSHRLFDQVRGATKVLYSNLTAVEDTISGVTAFNSDGFTLGSETGGNVSGQTFVSWCWDAGTSTVTNTAGSISSQVRANASAGFSVVTWTGTGSAATVGHGLGIAPHMAIIKRRDASGWDWPVWHNKLTSSTYNIFLNSTNAEANRSDIWSAAPTSALLNLGNSGQVNGSSGTYVGYIFAPVSGYSSFGSYTGNGSTDGPFVFCNFRPRWLLTKSSSYVDEWRIYDAVRLGYNAVATVLTPGDSQAEGATGYPIDLLSNGFKLRGAGGPINESGATYIYACFAESPFAYSRAR